MPGFKEIKKNIEEIKVDTLKNQEGRKSLGAPQMNPDFMEKQEKKTVIEKQKVVPLNQIKKLPIAQEVRPMTREEVMERREIFNDRAKKIHEEELLRLKEKIPTDRDNLVKIRTDMMEKYEYFDKNKVKHGDYRWKEKIPQEVREHYEWLMEYYKIHDDSIAEYHVDQNIKLPLKEYHTSVEGVDKIYESQGTNNCFCCAGTAMLNQFLRNRNNGKMPEKLYRQNDMRAYRPRVKKFNPASENIMDGEYRKKYIREVDRYAGAGKMDVGNVFEMGDFFLDELKDQNAMLNKMYFQMPAKDSSNKERDDLKSNNMKAVFMDKINEVTSTGNVVSLLEVNGRYGHYLTITGIDGDEITFLNSGLGNNSQVTQRRKVDDFLKRLSHKGNPVEIAWLSEMKKPEELTAEYSNLKYDAKTGYSLKKDNADSVTNVSQTKGIAVRKELGDMGPGMDGITQVAYIPNPLAEVESETIEEALAGQNQENRQEQKKPSEQKEPKQGEKKAEEKQEEKNEEKNGENKQSNNRKTKKVTKSTGKELETINEKSEEDEDNEEWSEELELKRQEEKKRKAEEKKRQEEEEERQRKEEEEAEKQAEHERQLTKGLEKYREHKEKQKEYERKVLERQKDIEKNREKEEREALEKSRKDREIRDVQDKISGDYRDKSKKQKKADRKVLSDYEKKNKDYETFGVAFTLDKVNVTAADSKYMRHIKTALADYLKIRQEIFAKHNLKADFAEAENHFKTKKRSDIIQNQNRHNIGKYYTLTDDEREILGNAYEVVRDAVKDYRLNHTRTFKFGRGKARYRQVRLIEEKLTMDNAKFFLSSERRSILKTVDMKYEKGSSFRQNAMPTWHRAIFMNDSIDVHNQRYRNKRRRQKAEGKLPPWYKRALQWSGLGLMNNLRRLVMAYEGIGGLIDRSLGLATMLAANSLTFAGKIVKAPIKILSGIFNGASKYIFRSKKRWKVDYSLREGWKSIDDGRRIFRKYMKGAFILPAAVTETLTRGIPYIFGHHYKSGVYKRTGRWSKAIYSDVKDVMKGIGFKDYGAPDRADADTATAGGIRLNDEGKLVERDMGNVPTEDDLFDEEFGENISAGKQEEGKQKDQKQEEEKQEDQKQEEKQEEEKPEEEKPEVKEEQEEKKQEGKEQKKDSKKNAKKKPSQDQDYTADDLNELKQRQDRIVADLAEYDKNNKEYADMIKQGDVKKAEAEIDEIDKVLDMYENDKLTGNIRKEDIDVNALKFKRARDISQLLVNEHSKKDSPEMKSAKIDVVKLSIALEDMKNEPATIETVGDIAAYYEIALKSLKDYLDTKKKNKRYDRVQAVWESLAFERDILNIYLQDPKELKGTIGNILHMSADKEGDIKRKRAIREVKIKKNAMFGPSFSDTATYARTVFGTSYSLSDAYLKPGLKAKDKKAETAKVLALREALGKFKPGKVQIEKINVLGKDIEILQKANNRLYVLDNHDQIPLNKNALLMCSQIEREMMTHSDIFGDKAVAALMDQYKGATGKMTSGEHMRIRSNLIEFLSSKLGVQGDAFTNIRRTTMITYAEQLIRGEKTADDIKKLMSNSKADQEMINGIELTELMELDEVRQEEINSHVSMYEVMSDKLDNDWSQEEKDVKNLLADFIFSTDTLIMDKNADNPEEYMRTVLLQNKKAVATLIKEDKADIIASVFEKMSLSGVKGVGNDELHSTIANGVKDIVEKIKNSIDTDGTIVELETKIETYLNNTKDNDLTDKLKAANSKMEQVINKSCDILQENVNQIVDLMFEKTQKGNDETLQDIIKSAAKGEEGQGKFTRQVLTNYFSKMSVIDKRSMLSSVIRSSRKVEESIYSDKELFDEIRSRRLAAYPSLLNKVEGFDLKNLSLDEKAQIEEYREKKRKLKVGANYFGGLIMGAGPLFQKMMQGLPEEELPEEVRMALSDVKSNLAPIPARIVKSQFNAMIEKSHGMITKIEVLKNLGAATVGQTFRCKMFGPTLPKEGKNVVIKLLRADVQNRMKRESKVMLDCAKATDEGMYETYQGQLGIYEKELDFRIEAENIKAGDIYNGRFNDVESEKINGIIDPTVNTLVLEEAPGSTLVDILLDAQKVRKDVRYDLAVKGKKNGKEHIYDYIKFDYKDLDKVIAGKNKLLDKVSDLIKKRDVLANMCNVWIDEALFKSGYYHADLHAGNMLINDSKLTMIDFGNAVKFDDNQQTAITQMMTAAAAGNTELFFSAFNLLLDMEDEKFTEFYDDKKQEEVKAAFEKILEMGSDEETGERISAALIRAQELGVKLPPAIYNFSQGQLRLQKSINDINNMISGIKSDIAWIESMQERQNSADAVSAVQNRVISSNRNDKDVVFKNYLDMFEPVNKEKFVKGLLDNTKKEAKLEKGIAEVDKRKEFNEKVLGQLYDFEENIFGDGDVSMEEIQGYRAKWEEYKAKWKDKVGTKEQIKAANEAIGEMLPSNSGSPVFDLFGGQAYLMSLMTAMENFDEEKVNEILSVYDVMIPAALDLEKKVKELYKLQDKNKLTEEKKQTLTDEIYELYNKLHLNQVKNNPISMAFKMYLLNFKDSEQISVFLEGMFNEKTTTKVEEDGKTKEVALGELFKEKYQSYIAAYSEYQDPKNSAIRDDAPPEIKKEIDKKQDELVKIHIEIATIQLKKFYNGFYSRRPEIKSYDFSKVMKDVIKANWFNFAFKKVGVGNLVSLAGVSITEIFKALSKE